METKNEVENQTSTETQSDTNVNASEHGRNSPDAVAFATIWNASSSRKDALARFATAGYTMSYSAMVARVKSYKNRDIHLKDIAPADRGRRLDVAAVNAALDGNGQAA